MNKENVSLTSALLSLVSGIALCFLSFFLSQDHAIDNSVLFYLGEMLVYAGSVLGLKEYVDYRMKKFHAPHKDDKTPKP